MAPLREIAFKKFAGKGFEYVSGGSGEDKNNNGIPDIDCSHLVYSSLRAAGYDIPYMTTARLNSPEADEYFEVVPREEAASENDDLILYNGHVGVFWGFGSTKTEGTFFGSQRKGPGIASFDEGETWGWGIDFKILRPRRKFKAERAEMQKRNPKAERWNQKSNEFGTQQRWSAGEHDLVHPRRWGGIVMLE
jgi:hypothetical protein